MPAGVTRTPEAICGCDCLRVLTQTKKEQQNGETPNTVPHVMQSTSIVSERNQQRVTDAVPLAFPTARMEIRRVGDMGDMAAGEGNTHKLGRILP